MSDEDHFLPEELKIWAQNNQDLLKFISFETFKGQSQDKSLKKFVKNRFCIHSAEITKLNNHMIEVVKEQKIIAKKIAFWKDKPSTKFSSKVLEDQQLRMRLRKQIFIDGETQTYQISLLTQLYGQIVDRISMINKLLELFGEKFIPSTVICRVLSNFFVMNFQEISNKEKKLLEILQFASRRSFAFFERYNNPLWATNLPRFIHGIVTNNIKSFQSNMSYFPPDPAEEALSKAFFGYRTTLRTHIDERIHNEINLTPQIERPLQIRPINILKKGKTNPKIIHHPSSSQNQVMQIVEHEIDLPSIATSSDQFQTFISKSLTEDENPKDDSNIQKPLKDSTKSSTEIQQKEEIKLSDLIEPKNEHLEDQLEEFEEDAREQTKTEMIPQNEEVPYFGSTIISICSELIPKEFSQEELSYTMLIIYRLISNRIYELYSSYFYKIPASNLIKAMETQASLPANKYPIQLQYFSKETQEYYMEHSDLSMKELFLREEGYRKAAETLFTAFFISNAIDALSYVNDSLLQIDHYALINSGLTGQIISFDDKFTLFYGVFLASDFPDIWNFISFLDTFLPKNELSPVFDFALANVQALALHCNELASV